MKQRDSLRVLSLKNLKGLIESYEKDKKKEITDEEVITLFGKYADQRRQNLVQFAGNADFCQKENYDLGLTEGYLPAMLSEEGTLMLVEIFAEDLKSQQETITKKDIGPLMKLVVAEAHDRGYMVDKKILSRLINDQIDA